MRKHLAAVGLFSALAITGVMTLTLNRSDTIPVRGKGLQLTCLTSGNFTADTIDWFGPRSPQTRLSFCVFIDKHVCIGNTDSYNFTADSKGAYANINSLSRENDSGTWRCAYRGENATIEIKVYNVPNVIVNLSGSTIIGSTAVLMCTAQGEPPQYTFHPWTHMLGQTEIRRLNGVNKDSISILTLSNISIQDMGSYICTVNNSITGLDGQLYQTGDTSVYVQGHPVIDKIQITFTAVPLKPASIQIPFYSHTSIQKSTFIKQIGSLEILNTSDISSYIQPSNITMMFYYKTVMIPGYVAVLQFRNLTETDFGNYTLTLTNDLGSETMQFEFIASVTPAKPINFHATNIQERQLSLMWQSGYHGRFPQTFVVETSQDKITWTNVSLVSDGNRDGWFTTVIDNLNPGSKYFFRLYGYNKHGRGEFADVQLAIRMWKESTNTQSIEDSTLLGIGVGAGVGGVVLGCIGAIVVFTFRRRLNGSKCSFFRSKGKTDDVTYLNTEMTSQPVKPIYEELNKGNVEHNMYDKIEHSAYGT